MSKKEHYLQFKADHADHIATLAAQIGGVPLDTHWDLIENVKGVMGTAAANECTDDEDEQEEAITTAEIWVADNLSGGGIEEDVAMALWLQGLGPGEAYLHKEKVTPPAPAHCAG